jgi:hypothetical protein
MDYLDTIVKYVDETTFAFDEHGNIDKTEIRQKNVNSVALLLFMGALEAAGEDPEEFINKE